MDQFFLEHATRTTNNTTKLYRGMTAPYDIANGESMIVHNYISTTTTLEAEDENGEIDDGYGGVGYFIDSNYYNTHERPPHIPDVVNDCCAYEMTIDKGIPFVDMEFSTVEIHENEILLPRNLLITLTGEYISEYNIHVRQIRVSKSTINQFENIPQDRCNDFSNVDINLSIIDYSNSKGGCRKSRHQKMKKKKNNTIKK